MYWQLCINITDILSVHSNLYHSIVIKQLYSPVYPLKLLNQTLTERLKSTLPPLAVYLGANINHNTVSIYLLTLKPKYNSTQDTVQPKYSSNKASDAGHRSESRANYCNAIYYHFLFLGVTIIFSHMSNSFIAPRISCIY